MWVLISNIYFPSSLSLPEGMLINISAIVLSYNPPIYLSRVIKNMQERKIGIKEYLNEYYTMILINNFLQNIPNFLYIDIF